MQNAANPRKRHTRYDARKGACRMSTTEIAWPPSLWAAVTPAGPALGRLQAAAQKAAPFAMTSPELQKAALRMITVGQKLQNIGGGK